MAIGCPRISVTSAASVWAVPVATLKEVSVTPATCSEIVFGGHETTTAGVPVVFATEATTVVAPGCWDLTTPFESTVATVVEPVLHVSGPTLAVMSTGLPC